MSNSHPSGTASEAPTVMAKPITLGELDPTAPGQGAPLGSSAALLGALKNVRVKLSVGLGGVTVPFGELAQARPQQVLVLEQGMEDPVDVLLEGHVIARGVLVAVGDRFGIRITEGPSAEGLAASPKRE